jgi:hypothetical protein
MSAENVRLEYRVRSLNFASNVSRSCRHFSNPSADRLVIFHRYVFSNAFAVAAASVMALSIFGSFIPLKRKVKSQIIWLTIVKV